jgi:hypothetical protein
LAYLDFNCSFKLTTDASKVAVAAILYQVQIGIRPLSYAARQINKEEQNNSASEAEIMSLGGLGTSDAISMARIQPGLPTMQH